MPRAGGGARTSARAARNQKLVSDDTAVTWYDVLGVLPTAPADAIERAYRDRASVLGPARLSGVPSKVLAAADRATEMLDQARAILGDPVRRQRYDISVGISTPGSGLERPAPEPSEPGWAADDMPVGIGAGSGMTEGAADLVLAALVSFLTWRPGPSRRVPVPAVRSLSYSSCLPVAARAGLRLNTVQLTPHPMPVDGLVVEQSPLPGVKARRGSLLTVQVWHPDR